VSHNPYAPPTVDDAPTPESSINPETRRLTHIVAERRIIMAGSTLFTFGLLLAVRVLLLVADSGAVALGAVGVIGLGLSMIAAGVALWLLHSVGRWMYLAYWPTAVSFAVGQQIQSGLDVHDVGFLVLVGLLIGAPLWRPRAQPVFEADYRKVVIPATPGISRWSAGSVLFHLLLLFSILNTARMIATGT
jgi:hypothetical protein